VPTHNGVDHDQRDHFVAFLERFADGQSDREQWERLVVNHYLDVTLERVRRDVVRIRMANEAMHWSPEERSQIRGWIRELRAATE
jgi:hypothetical protein